MRRPIVFALGVTVGSLAYPFGRLLGQVLFNHSAIYPHTKENLTWHFRSSSPTS